MQYTVRNRRRLKQTGSTPALTVTAPVTTERDGARAVPTVEARLAATTLERSRE